MLMLVMSIGYACAQGGADIKFDKTTHNFGTFSENNPVVSCTFTFTNVGDAPLVILRMHGARIHARAGDARQDRNHQDYLQRYRQISRTLQEVHYAAHQRQDRNDTSVR